MSEPDKSKQIIKAIANLAKTSPLSINELRVILALERIVARIEAHNTLRDKLIFKGGFVLLKTFDSQRFTRDIDALAFEIDKDSVVDLVKEALAFDLDDGLYYAPPEIQELVDQGDYGGYRVKVPFQMGLLPDNERKLKKLSRVHLDIGFGDVIHGKLERLPLPSLLEDDAPISWKVYPLESIYAEKLQTLVSRGAGNSRAKDVYDLVVMFDALKESQELVPALQETFKNRETKLPESFFKFASELDYTILERSWGSVDLAGGNISFEDCKERLKFLLKDLDLFLKARPE